MQAAHAPCPSGSAWMKGYSRELYSVYVQLPSSADVRVSGCPCIVQPLGCSLPSAENTTFVTTGLSV